MMVRRSSARNLRLRKGRRRTGPRADRTATGGHSPGARPAQAAAIPPQRQVASLPLGVPPSAALRAHLLRFSTEDQLSLLKAGHP